MIGWTAGKAAIGSREAPGPIRFSFAPWVLAASEVDRSADFTPGEDRIDLQAFHFADIDEVLAHVLSKDNHSVLDLGESAARSSSSTTSPRSRPKTC
jgi:hypothetical protein